MVDVDLAVIGGGIVGLATAMRAERFPGISVAVLEKEPVLARHQTGRNSGVIHAGVYYQPGSLKARFCREGVEATIRFCQRAGGPLRAVRQADCGDRGRSCRGCGRCTSGLRRTGSRIELLDQAEVSRREPRIRSLGGLYSPTPASSITPR